MTVEEQAIVDLENTNALLVEAVNVTKNSIQELIDIAVELAENRTTLALINAVDNSVKTQTLFLTYINQ